MFNEIVKMRVISTLNQIEMYCYSKNIPYGSFMMWAFGDKWEDIPLTKYPEAWNRRHEMLPPTTGAHDLLKVLLPMVDWYVQINKTV